MAYYLGIDGGGTKTRCAVGGEHSVLATATSGGSNIVRLGEAQAREALRNVIGQACAMARIPPREICAICIGAAGAARPEVAAKLRNIVAELIGTESSESSSVAIEVVGDTEIALQSAFGDAPGVIAIAGTGSVVFGRDAAGNSARAGGWGFAVSDKGSGHWIGRRAVTAILSERDRGRETLLTSLVLQAWNIASIDQLIQQANATPPPEFPRLSPVVRRAAENGDAAATAILSEAGMALAELASVVIGRLPALDPPSVAMTGSVFRQSQIVRDVFYNRLRARSPRIELCHDLVDPVTGALARARALAQRL